MNIRN
jgi:hypothetical protein